MKVLDSLLRVLGLPVNEEEDYSDEMDAVDEMEEETASYRARDRERDAEAGSRSRYSGRTGYTGSGYSSAAADRTASPVQVVLVKAKRFTEVERIAENIKNRRSVIVNFEEMDREEAQRTVDFLSGATFSMSGTVQKISKSTFVFAVGQVDLVGRIEEISRDHENFFAGF